MDGEYYVPNMLNSSLNADNAVNQLFLDEFKIQEDVGILTQLPDCGDFRGFYLQDEDALSRISKSAYIGFLKPS